MFQQTHPTVLVARSTLEDMIRGNPEVIHLLHSLKIEKICFVTATSQV